MAKVSSAEEYIERNKHNREALEKLRDILQSSEMEEAIKWGIPCYTVNGKNVIGLASFKSYVGMWFYNGALLKDKKNVLVSGGESTKAMRQWRFETADEIDGKLVESYVKEAIENQKQGRVIKAEKNKPLEIPAELEEALKKNPKAEMAFFDLSKSKKREYAEHISSAKREATKQGRLEKIIPMIEAGKGLHDKYRK